MNDPGNKQQPKKTAIPISPKSGYKPASDGTPELLRWGAIITLVGLITIGMLMTIFGGVGVEGAHSNSGWLALIIGAMCLPFGLMLLLLGAAKWLRNRGLARQHARQQDQGHHP